MAKGKYEYWKTEDGLTLLRYWARDGLLDWQIAKKMGISRSTLADWKNKHPDISDALKKSKEIVDAEVVATLYKKCLGYTEIETRAFKCKETYYDEKGRKCDRETVKTVEVSTYFPPDTLAIAMYLNNRISDKWRRNANKEKLDEQRFKHQQNMDDKRLF